MKKKILNKEICQINIYEMENDLNKVIDTLIQYNNAYMAQGYSNIRISLDYERDYHGDKEYTYRLWGSILETDEEFKARISQRKSDLKKAKAEKLSYKEKIRKEAEKLGLL